jgi:hypothetical protein
MVPDLGGIQAAIVAALAGAQAVTALLADGANGIKDDVPENYTGFPYVEVGEWSVVQEDASLSDGYDATLTLRIWSRGGGQKQVHQIFGVMRPVLHMQTFTVEGFGTVITQLVGFVTFKPADGITYPGTVRVGVIAAEK